MTSLGKNKLIYGWIRQPGIVHKTLNLITVIMETCLCVLQWKVWCRCLCLRKHETFTNFGTNLSHCSFLCLNINLTRKILRQIEMSFLMSELNTVLLSDIRKYKIYRSCRNHYRYLILNILKHISRFQFQLARMRSGFVCLFVCCDLFYLSQLQRWH